MLYKKGQAALIWIAVLLFGVLVLSQLGFLKGIGGLPTTGAGGQEVAAGTTGALCPDSSVTMTVGPAKVFRSATTDISNDYHRVIVGGIDQGLIRDSQTLSVRVGDGTPNNVVVYYSENSTERYAAESMFQPPCGAFTSASLSGGKHIVINQTQAITFNAFNQDDGDLNAIGNNATITTGEEVTFTTDFFGGTDFAVSPYGSVIAIVDYNDSEFDGTFFSMGGNQRTAVPTFHTPVNFATNFKSLAWKLPGGPDPSVLVDKSGRWTYKGGLTVKADATVNPTPNNVRAFFNVTLCDENWYLDVDDGKEKFGVENSRGVGQGLGCKSTVLYYQ